MKESKQEERILGRTLAVSEQEQVTGAVGENTDHSSWDLDNGQFSGFLIYDDLEPGLRPFRGHP